MQQVLLHILAVCVILLIYLQLPVRLMISFTVNCALLQVEGEKFLEKGRSPSITPLLGCAIRNSPFDFGDYASLIIPY